MAQSVLQLALKVQTGSTDLGVAGPVLVWAGAAGAGAGSVPLTTEAHRFPSKRPEGGDAVFFEVRKQPGARNAFTMGVTLGRTDTNDVALEDASVSRFHAWLQHDARTGAWRVVDAESLNGTWVGPLRLQPNRPEPLADGARLKLGSVDLLFLQPASFLSYLQTYRRR